MKLFLRIVQTFLPAFLRKKELKNLFEVTASALGCVAPSTDGMSVEECLAAYARFTRNEVDKLLESGAMARIARERLFRAAREVGRRYRSLFGVSTMGEAAEVERFLYRCLAIDFEQTSPHEITMHKCFFSRFYSVDTCRIVSALDDGLFDGLSGGGRLLFTRRITEGNDCCKATVVHLGDPRREKRLSWGAAPAVRPSQKNSREGSTSQSLRPGSNSGRFP